MITNRDFYGLTTKATKKTEEISFNKKNMRMPLNEEDQSADDHSQLFEVVVFSVVHLCWQEYLMSLVFILVLIIFLRTYFRFLASI